MQLSLSGRIVDVQYRYNEMSVPEFMGFARACGYDAVEFRATQILAEITSEQIAEFRKVAEELRKFSQ